MVERRAFRKVAMFGTLLLLENKVKRKKKENEDRKLYVILLDYDIKEGKKK